MNLNISGGLIIPIQLYNKISKVKLEYYKVFGRADFSDDTTIFRDNFMISVGFPRKVIINENSPKLSYFYFSIFLLSISILNCWSAAASIMFILNIMKLV